MVHIPSYIVRFLAALVVSGFVPISAQNPGSLAGGEAKLLGRIVLYDWVMHEQTASDEFVVKLLNVNDNAPKYARVIYTPSWGWDAPPAEAADRLDRLAFVGKGTKWQFSVHSPRSEEEKNACQSAILNHKYKDETGEGEIPRFVASPGADQEKIPPVKSLPCFILDRNGLTHE